MKFQISISLSTSLVNVEKSAGNIEFRSDLPTESLNQFLKILKAIFLQTIYYAIYNNVY